jgi:predicted HTH transcriptional regulator
MDRIPKLDRFYMSGMSIDCFKETIPSTSDLAVQICEFANGSGGNIFLGAREDGSICGITTLESLEEFKETIEKLVQNTTALINPQYLEPYRIECNVVKSTPRADSPKIHNSPRPRSSSSPRNNIKTVSKIFAHITIGKSNKSFRYTARVDEKDPPKDVKYDDLRRENDLLRKQLQNLEQKFGELEAKISRDHESGDLEIKNKDIKTDDRNWLSKIFGI